MQVSQALEALRDAKIDKKDWREVSGIMNEITRSRAWREEYETPTAWMEAAAEISGYTSAILRRMNTVRDFLERTKDYFGAPEILTDMSTRAPFAAMELLKRMYDVSPDIAKETFPKIVAGELTQRELIANYDELARSAPGSRRPYSVAGLSMSKAGKRDSYDFLRQAEEALQRNLKELTGEAQARFYFKEYKFEYVAPTAVAIKLKDTNIDWIDAFDVRYMPRGFAGVRKRQLIAEIAFGATFFRNYWLIVENAGAWIDGLVVAIKDLELQSIGVAEFDRSDDEKFKVRLKPELSARPDRLQKGILDVMKRGIRDLELS